MPDAEPAGLPGYITVAHLRVGAVWARIPKALVDLDPGLILTPTKLLRAVEEAGSHVRTVVSTLVAVVLPRGARYGLVARHLAWCAASSDPDPSLTCLILDPAAEGHLPYLRVADELLYRALEAEVRRRSPSRPVRSHHARLRYRQVCPVCSALARKPVRIIFDKFWRRHLAQGQPSPARCPRCGLILSLQPEELRALIEGGVPLARFWRVAQSPPADVHSAQAVGTMVLLVHLDAEGEPDGYWSVEIKLKES